jgi:hypothetical protein
MDIVLIGDGTHILVDVIIMDPIRANLVSRTTSSWGMASMIIAQAKIVLYYNKHPKHDFIPLVVKILGCLHQ